jgi:hypothetical protein
MRVITMSNAATKIVSHSVHPEPTSDICKLIIALVVAFGINTIESPAALSNEPAVTLEKSTGNNNGDDETSVGGQKISPSSGSNIEKKLEDRSDRYVSSYKQKCQTLMESSNSVTAGLLQQYKQDEEFSGLREVRQKVLQSRQQTTTELSSMRARLEDLQGKLRPNTMSVATMSVAGENPESLQEQRITTEAAIKTAQQRLETLQKVPPEQQSKDDIEKLRNAIQGAETGLQLLDMKIDRVKTATINERQHAEAELKYRQELASSVSTLLQDMQASSSDVECLNALENQIDYKIYSVLVPETEKNQFKLVMSLIFAFMVLVVIVLFFTVALRDRGIRAAIFSNQTGIQFVTLFSLVIAIILFGITEILQAKELSALLGGISGYILGRVTTDRSSATEPQANGQANPATAATKPEENGQTNPAIAAAKPQENGQANPAIAAAKPQENGEARKS